ncbi:hypothetical protein [Georgenia sp. SYP-B2076]|uniref:hypothetical protein n=1 Tax=Georgenia sp. SYP-B2076 TaxID=2495881 RepID=UPI000F8CAEC6|nr:hypothetical protein [Georgenia sp. SYP-B2076]
MSQDPVDPAGSDASAMRADVHAALGALALARAQMQACFPSGWGGSGAAAYADAVAALLHHAQQVARELRALDRAVAVADRERELLRAGGGAYLALGGGAAAAAGG